MFRLKQQGWERSEFPLRPRILSLYHYMVIRRNKCIASRLVAPHFFSPHACHSGRLLYRQ
jgi:hypothetical protein